MTVVNGSVSADLGGIPPFQVRPSAVLPGQRGLKGDKGDTGDPGVVVSSTAPSDTSLIWVDTS